MEVPESLILEPYTTFWGRSAEQLVSMGSFSYTHSKLPSSVQIGRYSSIAGGLRILGEQHPYRRVSTSPVFYDHGVMMDVFQNDMETKVELEPFEHTEVPIQIGNDVWIGEDVVLKPGIRVGDGAVIAAKALITKDVESFTIVGGIPARKIGSRFPEELAAKISALEWWNYAPDPVSTAQVDNPELFCSLFQAKLESGTLQKLGLEPVTYSELAGTLE